MINKQFVRRTAALVAAMVTLNLRFAEIAMKNRPPFMA
jgi:hypothetical protein